MFAFAALILTCLFTPVHGQIAPEKLSVHAQEPYFKSFAGLDLANEIRVDGARVVDANITLTAGPGTIELIDSQWFWHYKPEHDQVGQVFTVKYYCKSTSEKKISCEGMFNLSVNKLEPVVGDTAMFKPCDDDWKLIAYTKVNSQIIGKYRNLDGYYKIEIKVNGEPYKTITEPYAEFLPTFGKDEGKRLGIEIQFRSFQSKEYTLLRSESATIQPPPLSIAVPSKIRAGEELKIKALYGIEGDYSAPQTKYLEVESDGYFLPKALNVREIDSRKKKGIGFFGADEDTSSLYDRVLREQDSTGRFTFQFVLKPTSKMKPATSKDGKWIKVTFTDPITKQIVIRNFVVQSDT